MFQGRPAAGTASQAIRLRFGLFLV